MNIRFRLYASTVAFALVVAQAPNAVSASSTIQAGDVAPQFTLPDQNGKMVSLGDFAGKRSVVLYFYPKDDIGVCKKEACSFRDQYQKFRDSGAEVLGVSSDSIKSHNHFVVRRNLPFELLSDVHGKVRKLYGVSPAVAGLLPGRVTLVIDKQGRVRKTFDSFMHADKHVLESIEALKEIQ